jgi:uncharacterized protein YjbJ (UPF0337 family)
MLRCEYIAFKLTICKPSTSSHDGGQSTLSTAAASAKQIAGDVAQGVKTAVGDAMAWAEAKADKLAAKEEHGVGPYGSVATCAPSDLDVISTGVLPAMPSPDKERDVKTDGP